MTLPSPIPECAARPLADNAIPWTRKIGHPGHYLFQPGMQRLRNLRLLRKYFWHVRKALGWKPRYDSEILYWLRRLPPLRQAQATGIFAFPWGDVEYLDPGQLRAQFEEIFLGRQYAFSANTSDPVIIDCGGNIGLSAIWFKLNYPGCQLTVYEADPDVAVILQANLRRAGVRDVTLRSQAAWVANETVAFLKSGGDAGKIVSQSSHSCVAVDLSQQLPGRVDLLKLDIEGAEFQVLDRLCETQAIQRIQNLICEFHVWRNKTAALLATLAGLQRNGMQVAMKAEVVPWIGLADEAAPFEAVQRNNVLMEVFAWR